MQSKRDLTPRKMYGKIIKNAKIKMYVYGVFYYILNLITIITAFYISIIAILFLAGNNPHFLNNVNPYKNEFINNSSNYILLTTIINSVLSLISGILSLFVVNSKFIFYKKKVKQLEMEYVFYKSKLYLYTHNNDTNKFILYKRALHILETERYKSTALLDIQDYQKGRKNEQDQTSL
ncbi:DUF4231 domain-containing protein [Mycoplasma sp. 394]